MNSSIERKGSALVPVTRPAHWLIEICDNISSKYHDAYGEGVLLEEIAVRFGGEAHVRKAVREGRVSVRKTPNNTELFFVPRVKIGQKDSYNHTRQGTEKRSWQYLLTFKNFQIQISSICLCVSCEVWWLCLRSC